MTDVMTVLVCSIDGEPLPGEVRHNWMVESLPRARVLHLHRNLPQSPDDDPDFWPTWKSAIKEFHPDPIDMVFGSEKYIFQLADILDAKPVVIDPEREVFPVSGSAIMSGPGENWRVQPPPVLARHAKRICLLGPESAGKSILTKNLAAHYQTTYMPEYGRIYDENYKQTKPGARYWTSAELLDLARTHMAMCQSLMPHANRVLFEDTDLLQTSIWEKHLLGTASPEMLNLLEEYEGADFYIILAPTVPFTDDGGRYFPEQSVRIQFLEQAQELVKARGIPHVIVADRDWSTREASAFVAIREFLSF